jgi:hypothetical protein
MRARARTHCFFLFLLLLFDDQCIGDIVFQAYSRCPRRFTSIYYSLTNENEEKKKRECQASYRTRESTSTNLDNDAILFFLSVCMFIIRPRRI